MLDIANTSICIMLCTLNGADYIEEQLQSINISGFKKSILLISDDGSTDACLTIAEEVLNQKGLKFKVFSGPNAGYAENYRSLINAAEPQYDLFAFCDQDDIWHNEKLSVAAKAIIKHSPNTAVLYGSRTLIVTENKNNLGLSKFFAKPATFQNALVQNIAGGNTMVMNRAALTLLQCASANMPFVSHDWFAYQIITGADGIFLMDQVPRIDYRQHNNNAVGSNLGVWATLKRLNAGLNGRLSNWNDINIAVLENNRALLTRGARATLDAFKTARSAGFVARLVALRKSGVYRQTLRGTISLWIACTLKRL